MASYDNFVSFWCEDGSLDITDTEFSLVLLHTPIGLLEKIVEMNSFTGGEKNEIRCTV